MSRSPRNDLDVSAVLVRAGSLDPAEKASVLDSVREIEAMAERLDEEAEEIQKAALLQRLPYPEKDVNSKRKKAHRLRVTALFLRRLLSGDGSGTTAEMLDFERARHSAGFDERSRLHQYCNDASKSLRMVAEEVGTSHALLSQAAAGVKKIRYALALRVQDATRSAKHPNGYEPTEENWPKGWV